MTGRRLPDTRFGTMPAEEIQAGDYWKVLDSPYGDAPSNLTGTVWMVAAPLGNGYGLGTLAKHTVREEDDGTISVRHQDGSSNSILISRHSGESWHGFIEHGVWTATA